jgi:NhaP-type Na+/H+ or K+/H+ antiporter
LFAPFLSRSIYYFLKLISGTAETLIFVLLGVEVVTSVSQGSGCSLSPDPICLGPCQHGCCRPGWNTAFIISAYCFCLVYRAVAVFASSYIINRLRRNQNRISFKASKPAAALAPGWPARGCLPYLPAQEKRTG